MAKKHSTDQLFLWGEGDDTGRVCSVCKKWKKTNCFGLKKLPNGGRTTKAFCKQCDTKKSRRWKDDNPETAKRTNYAGHLRRQFGLTIEDYEKMFADQNGKCAICNTDDPGKRLGVAVNFQIDHCHSTGAIRALLCYRCNCLLGYASDNAEVLRNAIEYVEKYRVLIASGQCRIAEKKLVGFTRKVCQVEGCGRYMLAKGLCGKHYQQEKSQDRLAAEGPRKCHDCGNDCSRHQVRCDVCRAIHIRTQARARERRLAEKRRQEKNDVYRQQQKGAI